MKRIVLDEDSPLPIRANCGDSLLHLLWILPHRSKAQGSKSRVHPRLCVEAIDNTQDNAICPLVVALAQVVDEKGAANYFHITHATLHFERGLFEMRYDEYYLTDYHKQHPALHHPAHCVYRGNVSPWLKWTCFSQPAVYRFKHASQDASDLDTSTDTHSQQLQHFRHRSRKRNEYRPIRH
jgi:hypothetical protein